MNLEDFKSFRRVLKPSEVGSIPTHSRQLTAAVVALALLAAAARPAAADGAEPDIHPSPTNRAVRSMVFPAWGQVTNGREVKAAVLFSVQAWIWTRVIKESRAAHESEVRKFRLEQEGASALEITLADASAEEHAARRRDMLFWALFSSIYGALDAYVDANLGNFDEEIEEGEKLFADVDPARGSLALGIRF